MRAQTVLRTRPNYLVIGLLGLMGLLLCLFSGLMAAVMPPGTVVRLLFVPFAVMGLILLWMMPKRATAPDNFQNLLLAGLIVLINIWPTYIVYRFGGLPSVSPTKLMWLLLLGVAGINLFSSTVPIARLSRRCKAHPWLIFCVVFLFAWRVISSATGTQPLPQVLSLASETITCYAIFFVALATLRDEKDVFRLLALLLATAILQGGLASYESLVKHTLFDKFISVGSEDSATMIDMLREKFRDGRYRAQGTFEHPMVLAEFMAMTIPLAAVLFFSRKTGLWRWACAGFIPLAFGVIVFSRSRVGIAVLLAALLMVGGLLLLPRGKNAGRNSSSLSLVMAMFMLPVLLVAAYFALHEVSSLVAGRSAGEASSTMSRVLMLTRGVPLLEASPFFGYGNGMGAVKLGFFDGVRFNIDNYLLGVALDSGVPGLLAFIFIFAAGAWLGLRLYMQRADQAGLAAGFIAVSLVILLGCKTVLSIASGFTLAYVLIAAVIVLCETPPADVARSAVDSPAAALP